MQFIYRFHWRENKAFFPIGYSFSILRGSPLLQYQRKMVHASALTECAAQMQGWMMTLWRRQEEDLRNDVNRKVPLHTAPPLPMKLQSTGVSPHTFDTAMCWFSETRMFRVSPEMPLFPTCWIDAKSWSRWAKRSAKWSVNSHWNTVAVRKHMCPWWVI